MLHEKCLKALVYTGSTGFKIALVVRILISGIGIVLISLCVVHYNSLMLIHPNGKALLFVHYLWTILQSFSYIGAHLFDFIRLVKVYDDPCEYFLPSTILYYARLPINITVFGVAFSMLSVAIERLIAAFYYRTYENSSNKGFVAVAVVAQILLALTPNVVLFPGNPDPNEFSIKTSIITRNNAHATMYIGGLHLLVTMLSFTIFHGAFIWARNKYVVFDDSDKTTPKGVHSQLSSRYQLAELKKTLKAEIALIWINSIVNVIADVAAGINDILKPELVSLYFEFISIIPLYSMLLPVTLFFSAKMYQQRVSDCSNQNDQHNDSERGKDTEKYFELLNKALIKTETIPKPSRNCDGIKP